MNHGVPVGDLGDLPLLCRRGRCRLGGGLLLLLLGAASALAAGRQNRRRGAAPAAAERAAGGPLAVAVAAVEEEGGAGAAVPGQLLDCGILVAVGELPARGRGGVEVPFFCFSFLFEKRESRAMRLGFLSFFWVETGDWRDEEMNEEVVARSCGSSRGAEPSWFCAERNTRGFCSGVCSGVCSLEKPWRERTKKKTVSCLFRALYFLNFHSLAQAALLVLLKSSRRGGRRRSWK